MDPLILKIFHFSSIGWLSGTSFISHIQPVLRRISCSIRVGCDKLRLVTGRTRLRVVLYQWWGYILKNSFRSYGEERERTSSTFALSQCNTESHRIHRQPTDISFASTQEVFEAIRQNRGSPRRRSCVSLNDVKISYSFWQCGCVI